MIFATLGLSSGYRQVETEETERDKTAFTFHQGQSRFLQMCFELKSAPRNISTGAGRQNAPNNMEICIGVPRRHRRVFAIPLLPNYLCEAILNTLTKHCSHYNCKHVCLLQRSYRLHWPRHLSQTSRDSNAYNGCHQKTEATCKYFRASLVSWTKQRYS